MKSSFSIFFRQLNESYADAQRIFSSVSDPDTVKQYIDKFKDLSQRNILKPDEKDITRWIKSGFNAFASFVDSHQNIKTKRQEKLDISKDAIKVYENSKWMVIIPLTAQASCKYGANTKWCTAGNDDNKFNSYFHGTSHPVTLFYIISKVYNEKYAVSLYEYNGEMVFDCFDDQDDHIPLGQLTNMTGFTVKNFRDWEYEHLDKLEHKRTNFVEDMPRNIVQRCVVNKTLPTPEEFKKIIGHKNLIVRYLGELGRTQVDWPEFNNYILTCDEQTLRYYASTGNFLNYMRNTKSISWPKIKEKIIKTIKDKREVNYIINMI